VSDLNEIKQSMFDLWWREQELVHELAVVRRDMERLAESFKISEFQKREELQ